MDIGVLIHHAKPRFETVDDFEAHRDGAAVGGLGPLIADAGARYDKVRIAGPRAR